MANSGHGGFDGGAVASDGTAEKDINLSIAMYLGEFLETSGYSVVYTRTEDVGTEDDETDTIRNRKRSDLYNRLALTEKYPGAIFISIHLNKFTQGNVSGAQVFYSSDFDTAKSLSEEIQKSIKEILQPSNNRVIKKGNDSTFLLKNAVIPSVIVECGFLSNNEELLLLKNSEYQRQTAFAVYCGIINYLNKG